MLLLLYGMMAFFSGALKPAYNPGGKGNLRYLTLLFKKPHSDVGDNYIHMLLNVVSGEAGHHGFSHLNISVSEEFPLNLHQMTEL